tara:strand:- start:32 stop:292 length:261 start_codon:yes stop_codon:yes gene_type:complete
MRTHPLDGRVFADRKPEKQIQAVMTLSMLHDGQATTACSMPSGNVTENGALQAVHAWEVETLGSGRFNSGSFSSTGEALCCMLGGS